MRRFSSIFIIFILLSLGASAQETDDLDLPIQLYFHNFTLGSLFFIQDNIEPIQVYSTEHAIFEILWSPYGDKIAIISNAADSHKLVEIYSGEFQLIHQFDIDLYENDLTHFPMSWASNNDTLFWITTSENDKPQIASKSISTPAAIEIASIPLLESEEISQIFWSPDTTHLLYLTSSPSNHYPTLTSNNIHQPETHKLYLLNLATEESSYVMDMSYKYCVAWSEEGNNFATISHYSRDTDFPFLLRASHLQIYDLQSELKREIAFETTLTNSIVCPMAWSNNGQYIALGIALVDDENQYFTGIALLNLVSDEIEILNISDSSSYLITSMEWSYDDSWIAIETLYSAFGDIRLVSFDSGEEFRITRPGTLLVDPKWRNTRNNS